jgi:O-antigen biosynthesis protein WbqP
MLRMADLTLALFGLVIGSPIFLILFVLGCIDTGSPLFFQMRVGRDQRPFILVKFRTMKLGTSSAPSHLVDASAITPLGYFLRRSKLDELPQFWNVLIGDMSFVGPRPCLPTQKDLIFERAIRGVFNARPGITGLAQVDGIDMSRPYLLAEVDARMLRELNLTSYCRYILRTIAGAGRGDGIQPK